MKEIRYESRHTGGSATSGKDKMQTQTSEQWLCQ